MMNSWHVLVTWLREVMLKWLLQRFHFKDGLRKVWSHRKLKLSGSKTCLRSEDYQYPECKWELPESTMEQDGLSQASEIPYHCATCGVCCVLILSAICPSRGCFTAAKVLQHVLEQTRPNCFKMIHPKLQSGSPLLSMILDFSLLSTRTLWQTQTTFSDQLPLHCFADTVARDDSMPHPAADDPRDA